MVVGPWVAVVEAVHSLFPPLSLWHESGGLGPGGAVGLSSSSVAASHSAFPGIHPTSWGTIYIW